MESLELFHTKKEWLYFLLASFLLLLVSLYFVKYEYDLFKKDEIYHTSATVLNIYPKKTYDILKLKTDTFEFFTSVNKNHNFFKQTNLQIYLLTKEITFYKFLKGFYANNINIQKIDSQNQTFKNKLSYMIDSQHQNKLLGSLYKALFLAIPIDTQLRDFFANLSITHLIAISGFHLGILSFVLYFLFNYTYKPIHQKYFPFRNKRFDAMVAVCMSLFFYLLLTDSPPSLLRSFVMFVFAFLLLRFNIKLLSFETLFVVVVVIIALFPKLLFSLAFWFSVSGVFYIFLYIHYFKNINKYLHIILFNFWIFFAMNPISHYFFGNTAFEQLLSPLITLLFSIFYPISLLLHLIQAGDLFDAVLLHLLSININSIEVFTPLWVFISFILLSFFSIYSQKSFYLLNVVLILFNFHIYFSMI